MNFLVISFIVNIFDGFENASGATHGRIEFFFLGYNKYRLTVEGKIRGGGVSAWLLF
jgi:hypothetical protein